MTITRAPFLIFTNLAIALALVFSFSSHLSAKMPGQNAKSVMRFAAIKKNLDEIAIEPEDKTLFFGTSIFQFFLDPSEFDRALAQQGPKSKSYNLAFEGLFGPGQLALVARLESEFYQRNSRFRASVFELSPACLNRRFYDRHREMLDFVLPSIFLNFSTWIEMFVKDAPGTSYLLFDQIFRPASWTLLFSLTDILGIPREDMIVEWPELVQLWTDKKYSEIPAWKLETAGLSNWNFPQTKVDFEAELRKIHEPQNWERMVLGYRRGNNVNEHFAFSQRIVDLYIESVNTAAKFSQKTYIVLMPYAPSLQKLVDRYVDYQFLIKTLKSSSSATILDMRNALPLTDDDFADAMHLKHQTMNRISNLIAERVAADLREH